MKRRGPDTSRFQYVEGFPNHIFHKWFQKYKYNSRLIYYLLFYICLKSLFWERDGGGLSAAACVPSDACVFICFTDVCVMRERERDSERKRERGSWVGGILQSSLNWTPFCRSRCSCVRFPVLILQFCDEANLYTISCAHVDVCQSMYIGELGDAGIWSRIRQT